MSIENCYVQHCINGRLIDVTRIKRQVWLIVGGVCRPGTDSSGHDDDIGNNTTCCFSGRLQLKPDGTR